MNNAMKIAVLCSRGQTLIGFPSQTQKLEPPGTELYYIIAGQESTAQGLLLIRTITLSCFIYGFKIEQQVSRI